MTITYFTHNELYRLLRWSKKHAYFYYAAYYLAVLFGLRVSEVCQLRQSDLADGKVNIRRLKGSRMSVFQASPEVLQVFNNLDKGKKRSLLFPVHRSTFDRVLKEHCKRLRIDKDKAHFHSFKHTTAMMLMAKGSDVRTIQEFLGHVSINNTIMYLRLSGQYLAGELIDLEQFINNTPT